MSEKKVNDKANDNVTPINAADEAKKAKDNEFNQSMNQNEMKLGMALKKYTNSVQAADQMVNVLGHSSENTNVIMDIEEESFSKLLDDLKESALDVVRTIKAKKVLINDYKVPSKK